MRSDGSVARRKGIPMLPGMLIILFIFLVMITLGSTETLRGVITFGGEETTSEAYGPVSVQWLAGGEHLAIQWFDHEDGTPCVDVWDSRVDELTSIRGYVIVLAEKAAPVLWMLPMDAGDWAESRSAEARCAMRFPYDSPPARLAAWDLEDAGSRPRDLVPARWSTIEGPGGLDAFLEVDALKGVYPSKILFNNKALSGEGHRAELPDEMVTFWPVGWSASGEYFAVEEMLGPQEYDDLGVTARDLIVIEGSSGQVAGSVTLGDRSPSPVIWHPTDDVLMWSCGSEDDSVTGVELKAYRPGEAVVWASEALGTEVPAEWDDAWRVWMAGSSDERSIWVSESEGTVIWGMEADSIARIGVLPHSGSYTAWSEGSGIAVVESDWGATGSGDWAEVAVYDDQGENRQVVWRERYSCEGGEYAPRYVP